MVTKQQVIDFWINGSLDAFETAQSLIKIQKYHFGLFFCQLAIEKYLKALTVQLTDQSPLPTHDLILLAKKAQIPLSDTQDDQLRQITKFNIEARYDSIKLKFYQQATPTFTHHWLHITEEILTWLKTI